MSFCMAVNIEDGINIGKLIDDALRNPGVLMSHKEAASDMRTQESKFSEALSGERPLDLWKMRHLPIRFWQIFLPALASELIQQWMVDRCRPYRMLKCELREDRKEKSA